MADAATPFRTWNGVEAWQFADGVRLHAIGGEQILLCRVTYEPGKQVPDHNHEHTEQVMAIVDGEVRKVWVSASAIRSGLVVKPVKVKPFEKVNV